jgi:hypothetical protein
MEGKSMSSIRREQAVVVPSQGNVRRHIVGRNELMRSGDRILEDHGKWGKSSFQDFGPEGTGMGS